MKFIATKEALLKLNMYEMTELEVRREFEDTVELDKTNQINEKMFFNMKNKDLIILPIGRKTALITEMGVELKGSYEDLPQIIYKDNEWRLK